jgi:hypothetical protein
MAQCYIYTSYQACDECQYKYECQYYNVLHSSDKPDDPCEGCDGRNRRIVKDGYDLGPHWHTCG